MQIFLRFCAPFFWHSPASPVYVSPCFVPTHNVHSFLSLHCVFQIKHGFLRGSQPILVVARPPQDFLSLRPQWMIEKDGYIFVYSMNSRHSLDELQHFYELHQQINEHRDVPIVLVANKKDLCGDGRGQGHPQNCSLNET